MAQDGANMAPRTPQDAPRWAKMAPTRHQNGTKNGYYVGNAEKQKIDDSSTLLLIPVSKTVSKSDHLRSFFLRCPQAGPKRSQDGPKLAPRGQEVASRWPRAAPGGAKMASGWPKTAPRWPNMVPRWPKIAQDGPKMAPRWPKKAQTCPNTAPTRPQDAPKILQDAPR